MEERGGKGKDTDLFLFCIPQIHGNIQDLSFCDLPSTSTHVVAKGHISNKYKAETDTQFRELFLPQGRGVGETQDR